MHNYKNICQQTAVSSLEKIIKFYVKSAEDEVKNIKGELDKVILDMDDLEGAETPERLVPPVCTGWYKA